MVQKRETGTVGLGSKLLLDMRGEIAKIRRAEKRGSVVTQ